VIVTVDRRPFFKPLILLMFLAVSVHAQTPEKASLAACLFPIVDLTGTEQSAPFGPIIDASLKTNLQSLGLVIIAEESWKRILVSTGRSNQALSQGPVAVPVARQAGARVAVSGLYLLREDQLVMNIKIYDSETGRVVAGTFSASRVGVTLNNRINEAIDQLTPQLERFLQPAQDKPQDISPFVLEVTLLSPDEGMEISIAGVEAGGRIRDGRLTLPFIPYPVGSKLLIRKTKAGYHDAEETVALTKPRTEAALRPLVPQTRYTLNATWTTGQLLGLGIGMRYYLKPDDRFLGVENYSYLQRNPNPGSVSVPHNDLGVCFGQYLFFRPDSPIRFGLAAGLGLIVTTLSSPDTSWHTDFYLTLASPWVEWNYRSWLVYLRADARYVLDIGPNLIGGDWFAARGSGPPLTLGVARKW
jgi:hypothetical protein